MSQKLSQQQPSQEQRRTRLAAQLLAVLKSSEDFEWACSVLEQGGNGGKIVLTVDGGGYIKFISNNF
jgi:hypothetical protein